VAIDFQLFVLTLALLALAPARPFTPVAVLAAASLLVFNRQPPWDIWAPYFYASYAFGAFAWWTARRACPVAWGAVLVTVALAALAIEFRMRIAVALAVAVVLYGALRSGVPWRWAETRVIACLARISYSVFLVHFPVCLIVNAAWTRFLPPDPWTSLAGMATAWAASIAAGALLHRLVESRVDAIAARLAVLAASFRRAGPAAK
jgi:peptidoglycan/LPS O-acetylase OafA/YrhL